MDNPPSKDDYKKIVKSHVLSYWENQLRGEASVLSSLAFFKPNFMSLTKPHPLWTTTNGNPHEVSKAVQQARFLSGRYRTNSLIKHWNPGCKGLCSAPDCENVSETIGHILLECQAYTKQRQQLIALWLATKIPEVYPLILEALTSSKEYLLQFIIDCSSLPKVISSRQQYGDIIHKEIFRLTRTWCFVLHRERMRLLGRWST